MKIKKILYVVAGCFGVVMGAIGSIVPLLPAFPFLLLATVCFAKSSERLHTWFIGTPLYKKNLESYVAGKGMTVKTKIRIMVIVTLTMAFGYAMMGNVPVGRGILVCVWILHVGIFLFGIKTLSEEDERAWRAAQLAEE
ncbi:MAG: YbaN family protein [Lachnospiraceae bacterium]|nr:YbaN family protein [Lachnospiraceae bacterium]